MKELAFKIYETGREEGLISDKKELSFKYLPAFEDDVKFRVPDIQKAKNMLGWQPIVGLTEALKKCIRESHLGV